MENGGDDMINDSAFLGIYTLKTEITNDITLNSVLSEFIGSGEIWVKRNIQGDSGNFELLAIIFRNDVNTVPYWTRISANGKIRTEDTDSLDYFMNAPVGTQFYRFSGYGGNT